MGGKIQVNKALRRRTRECWGEKLARTCQHALSAQKTKSVLTLEPFQCLKGLQQLERDLGRGSGVAREGEWLPTDTGQSWMGYCEETLCCGGHSVVL